MNKDRLAAQFENIFQSFSLTSEGRYTFLGDLKNNVSYWSQEAVDFFGLSSSKLPAESTEWLDHIEPPYLDEYKQDIEDVFSGKKPVHEMIYRAKSKDGKYVTCTCRGMVLRDEEGNPEFFAGTITNHEGNNSIDPTTGLYTRANLLEYLRRRTQEGKHYYLLIIGILNFFDINSTYGYLQGNVILKAVSEYILSHAVVHGLQVFRCEGTKFALTFMDDSYTLDDVRKVYNEIRDYLNHEFTLDGHHISINISGGCVLSSTEDASVNAIYNSALFALSRAKEDNETEFCLFSESNFYNNAQRIEILSAIRNSIGNGFQGFYLVYQPIVNAHTEQITGAEALLRWQDEVHGTVPPNLFIPWLEKDPVFYELGNWILRKAMEDTKPILKIHPDFMVNVNLAYPQLQRADFKKDLMEMVRDLDFPPQNLKLELTERCKLLNMSLLRELMIFFRTSGFQTALDDFGTGYSALNLLTDLPIHQIKIDRSYIQGVENDPAKQSLLKAIIGCANELGKGVCVEGIETAELRQFLLDHYPITNIQGYYYSRPLAYPEFTDWITVYDQKLAER